MNRQELKKHIAGLTREQRVSKAARILADSHGKFNQVEVLHYLTDECGLTMTEYLEALNAATGGGVIEFALGKVE